ncbi:hypothetical protein [Nocardia otitidiscaviarum]|uniref:hypothetical protein n=1 Tax=Nocardia otitidiscaviarum TaxID=1823 RepID=UPI0018940B09|nr:hypothetical protein [Nocardia otitidiscaviarum]MBF6182110.1 hypothetical protein [Nocardia otitidiscaviarum]
MFISSALIDLCKGIRDRVLKLREAGEAFSDTSRQVGGDGPHDAVDAIVHEDREIGPMVAATVKADHEPSTASPGPSDHSESALGYSIPGSITRGRDLIDDLDYRALDGAGYGTNHGGRALGEVNRRQGFDGPPTLVSREELDQIVAAGGVELFRGVSDPRFVAEFKSGSYFPGTGQYGEGTYATPDVGMALRYADHRSETLLRMALKPDAKVVDYLDLYHEQQAELRSISEKMEELRRGERPHDASEREEELESRYWQVYDRGKFAAIKGYDAFSVGGTEEAGVRQEWIILNRTALAVER